MGPPCTSLRGPGGLQTLEWPASLCRWSLDGSAAGGDQCEGREEVATQVGPSQLVKGADEAAELKEEQPAEVISLLAA